jgi:membrane protease YdiL (CAAX protease family)
MSITVAIVGLLERIEESLASRESPPVVVASQGAARHSRLCGSSYHQLRLGARTNLMASKRASSSAWIGWSVGVACAIAGGGAAAWLAVQHGYRGGALGGAIAALVLLLVPYFLSGTTDLTSRLAAWVAPRRSRALAVFALPLIPYLMCVSGAGWSFTWIAIAKLVGYAGLPLVLLLWARSSGPPPRVQDAFAVLAIWLPLELGVLRDVWLGPSAAGSSILASILGVDLAVILFVSVRGLEGVGYSFTIRRADLVEAFWNLLMFLCIAIPVGLWTRFIAAGHGVKSLLEFAAQFVGIFLAIAIPEELLFRGLIQNLLGRVLPSTYALLLTAVIFGLSHLNNGPAPDWRYVGLASVAGIFYGRAYQRSGGLMAACLVHASVDTIWRELFR